MGYRLAVEEIMTGPDSPHIGLSGAPLSDPGEGVFTTPQAFFETLSHWWHTLNPRSQPRLNKLALSCAYNSPHLLESGSSTVVGRYVGSVHRKCTRGLYTGSIHRKCFCPFRFDTGSFQWIGISFAHDFCTELGELTAVRLHQWQ